MYPNKCTNTISHWRRCEKISYIIMVWFNVWKWREDGKIHYFQWSIKIFLITTIHRNIFSQDINQIKNHIYLLSILYVLKKLCRWIIHSLIRISDKHQICLHPCCNPYALGMIIFVLDISNVLKNNIIPNPVERVCHSLPHIYLKWFERKWPKHPLAPNNPK